jgi:hypothetical protein
MKTIKYPVERKDDEQPHYTEYEPAFGIFEEKAGYWCQFLFCTDKSCVSGVGQTPEGAMADASKQRRKREAFISSDARVRILNLIEKGCRGTQEQNDLNNAFAEMLLQLYDEVSVSKKRT